MYFSSEHFYYILETETYIEVIRKVYRNWNCNDYKCIETVTLMIPKAVILLFSTTNTFCSCFKLPIFLEIIQVRPVPKGLSKKNLVGTNCRIVVSK